MALPLKISVIVCAHNEARYLPACLHSVLAQSRVPDQILVINNASTDQTSLVASAIPHVEVVDEPRKGLVVARETGRRHASGEVLIYLDADCRALRIRASSKCNRWTVAFDRMTSACESRIGNCCRTSRRKGSDPLNNSYGGLTPSTSRLKVVG